MRRILALLKSRFIIDLSQYKATTVRRRLERRRGLDGFDDLSSWAEHLEADPEALKALHDDLFIHVTEFFRDPPAFAALAAHVFPKLLENHGDGPLRVWVPGCSTGEEAYSLAMALTEAMDRLEARPRLQLFATDVSEAAVAQARRAVFTPAAVKAISPERLERFFDKVSDGFKLKKDLRDACIISRHDVTTQPPFAKLDLVSCRNVLIYFGPELQKRIVGIFHYALKPSGFLWLGHSETPGTSTKLFSLVDKTHKIYAKLPSAKLHLATGFHPTLLSLPQPSVPAPKSQLDYADQVVLSRYGPPGVVVSSELEVLQFRGHTAPWLEHAPGRPTTDLLKLAHPAVAPALRALLRTAKHENKSVRRERVSVGPGHRATLEVTPLNPAAPEAARQYLVLFDEQASKPARAAAQAPKSRRGKAKAGHDARVEELELELEAARQRQQALVEQFEAVQEELTSSNEELQATNEELQSTNEELETAKEELQAANEELTTTNEELLGRNTELHALNERIVRTENRFRMMVEGVKEYAIYMLDPDGRVESWNEGARRLKGYEASEIVGQNYSRFFLPADVAAGAPVHELETARIEGRFEAEGWRIRKDGTQFWANVVVTRINDASGKLIGFSKVTRDLTERMKAAESLRRMNETLEERVRERTEDLGRALKVRDEFLSIASHELKTPLTSLKLKLQLARRNARAQSNEGAAASFDESLRQLAPLEELIEDLLDVSRIQTGQLKLELTEVDVSTLVREVTARFAELAQAAGVRVTVDVEPGLTARWDARRVGQVLANLMSNAFKYAPESDLEIRASSEGGVVWLKVKDGGPGIALEKQASLFERFERAGASPSVGGLGLGLFISRRIAEAHGGIIKVESAPGQGACFTVELPRLAAHTG